MKRTSFLCAALILCGSFPAVAGDPAVLFREDFASLIGWQPLTFPGIKAHSTYAIERDGDRTFLRAESSASASAVVHRGEFDVYQYPKLKWRWRIQNIYRKANATTREGDDFPIRIYVLFTYDPRQAGFGDRISYGFAKALYGEYPPHSSLVYAWSSREHAVRIITSPYTGRAKEILLRQGPALTGTWQDEEVDILEDYEAAFGKKPPRKARLAIMNDSDNTGERSVSWVDHIEVGR